MTFQFEDDSALEELLNQQLDRNKRTSVSTNLINKTARSTKKQLENTSDKLLQDATNDKALDESRSENSPSRSKVGKLSNWLYQDKNPSALGNNKELDEDIDLNPEEKRESFNLQAQQETTMPSIRSQRLESNQTQFQPDIRGPPNLDVKNSIVVSSDLSSNSSNLLRFGNENELQQMTKQSLIRLVLDQFMPEIHKSNNHLVEIDKLKHDLAECRAELDKESLKRQAIMREHDERSRLTESSWNHLNKQLEYRLEVSQTELKEVISRYDIMMAKFESDHQKQIDFIVQNYQARLEEQQVQSEAELKRRQAIHELEMSSRLRIQGDMKKLDSIYDCWQVTIEGTIKQLEQQFRSIESLLDKQTSTIRWNNEELMRKNESTSEQAAKLETQLTTFDNLTNSIKTLLDNLTKKVGFIDDRDNQLVQANVHIQELKDKILELDLKRESLNSQEKELEQEKFELRLTMQRLHHETNRLDELKETNEVKSRKIEDRENVINDIDQELKKRRLQIDHERTELDQDREQLELDRKGLRNKRNELDRWQVDLGQQRRILQKQFSKLNYDNGRLVFIKNSVQKELLQLKRLQRSLVCSICLQRLCEVKPDTDQPYRNRDNFDIAINKKDKIHDESLVQNSHKTRNIGYQNISGLHNKLHMDQREIIRESMFVKYLHESKPKYDLQTKPGVC